MKQTYCLGALLLGMVVVSCPSYGQDAPSKSNSKEFLPTTDIVGGVATNINVIPWQVLLEVNGADACGGSIIAPGWIITAAHCVEGRTAAQLKVYAGISQRSQKSTGQMRTVAQIIIHQNWGANPNSVNDNDIALLRLNTPLTFNTNVQSIRYATDRDATIGLTNVGISARISGWGLLGWGGVQPNQLQSALVPIQSNVTAAGQYNPLPGNLDITANMIPAGFPAGNVDACTGDSGGPLIVFESGIPVLAGIVSYGFQCARPNFFGIYTRVSRYCDWIADRVATIEGPTATGVLTVCTSSTMVNLRNGPATGATVTWTATPASRFTPSSGTGTSAFFRATNNSPGTGTISFTINSGCGTTTVARNININMSPVRMAQTTYNGPYATIYASVDPVPGALSYEWYLNGQFQQVSSYNHEFTVDDCGSYYTSVRVRTSACSWSALSSISFYVTCSGGNFTVYPNPANEQLTIEQTTGPTGALSASVSETPFTTPGWNMASTSPSFSVELYDAQQKVVATGAAKNAKIQLDTSKLPAGSYYLQIYNKEGTIQQQVIIE